MNSLHSITVDLFVVETDKRALCFSLEIMGTWFSLSIFRTAQEHGYLEVNAKVSLTSKYLLNSAITALDIVISATGIADLLFKAPAEISNPRNDTFGSLATDLTLALGWALPGPLANQETSVQEPNEN